MTFHVKRWPTCPKILWSLLFKLMFDSAGSSQWSWNFENVSWDFDWKFGYAACCSQICAPHLLTDQQKQRCLEVGQNLFYCANDDENILKNIIAGDDTWVYSYDVEIKPSLHNRSQKCHPDPEKHGKFGQMWRWCWLSLCFEGVIHHEFLPHGQTVNKEYYLEVIKRLWEAGRRKRPILWREKKWMLQHNASTHSTLLIHDFLAKYETTIVLLPL